MQAEITTKITILDAFRDAGFSFCIVMGSFYCAQILDDVLDRPTSSFFKLFWFLTTYATFFVAAGYAIRSFMSLTASLDVQFQAEAILNNG